MITKKSPLRIWVLLSMILGLVGISFAANVIGDVATSSSQNRTIKWETSLYTESCDIKQDLIFYEKSPIYLRVGQPRGQVSYVFDTKETFVRVYNQPLFVGDIRFPYVSNFVPSTTVDSTDWDVLTVEATGVVFSGLATVARGQVAGQIVTINNERSIIQNANGATLNYYFVKANNPAVKNGTLKVSINPNLTKKVSCTNYYVARCGDGIIDKATWTSDGNWGIVPQGWSFIAWHAYSIKPNEVCDDGADNGKPGKCKTDCTGIGGWDPDPEWEFVVTKTLTEQKQYAVGQDVQFRINFSNNTNKTLQNIEMEDLLPGGFEFVSSEIIGHTAPVYFSTGTVQWQTRILYTGFSLSAGQSWYILLNTKLLSCNQINSVFWKANMGETLLTWYSNKDVSCASTPITITKTIANPVINLWGSSPFTIQVTNATPNTITNVVIQDIWTPNSCLFITGVATANKQITQVQNWNITDWALATWLLAGESITVNFIGQANTLASCVWIHLNTGKVSYREANSSANASAQLQVETSVNVTIAQPIQSMSINKIISQQWSSPWDPLQYTISYANNWPNPINWFRIVDYWPEYLDFKTSLLPNGTNLLPTIEWRKYIWTFSNTLVPGATWSIIIQAEISRNIP